MDTYAKKNNTSQLLAFSKATSSTSTKLASKLGFQYCGGNPHLQGVGRLEKFGATKIYGCFPKIVG